MMVRSAPFIKQTGDTIGHRREVLHHVEVLRIAIEGQQTSLPVTSPKRQRAARAIPTVVGLLAIAAVGVSYVNRA
jgi:hypothetical protein